MEDLEVPGPQSLTREEAGQEVEGRGGRSSWTSGLMGLEWGLPVRNDGRFSTATRGPSWASLGAQMVENLPADAGDLGSMPGWGRAPGGGQGNPLQYSCLENPIDGGAWQATVHRVAQS